MTKAKPKTRIDAKQEQGGERLTPKRTVGQQLKANRERLDAAIRYGHLQLAVAVLGNAVISHHGNSYVVNELTGDRFLVLVSGDARRCNNCNSEVCLHASLVRLYLARIGKHGVRDLGQTPRGRLDRGDPH